MDDETVEILEEEAPSSQEITQDDLKALLDTERKQRAAAEARVAQAERERDQYKSSVQSETQRSELTTVDYAIQSRVAEADNAEREAAEAYAQGNFAAAMAAQRKMAALEADVVNLKGKKVWLEQQKAQKPAQDDLAGFSEKQKEWIRNNPEYRTNAAVRAKVAAAHYEAEAEGIAVDSDEYFEKIESKLKPPAKKQREESVEMPVQRRSTIETPQPRGNVIRLTPEEREAADISLNDVPVNDYKDRDGNVQPGRYRIYAENKLRIAKREGR